MIPHFYENPLAAQKSADEVDPSLGRKSVFQKLNPNVKTELDEGIDVAVEEFYVDVYEELAKYGKIQNLVLSDNLCDHLVGNVYIKYYSEKDAEKAVKEIDGRFYNGRTLRAFLTHVNDFEEARCRQFYQEVDKETLKSKDRRFGCDRAGDCNFLHEIPINKELIDQLKKQVA